MCGLLKGKQKDEATKPGWEGFRDETLSKHPGGCHRTPTVKKLKMNWLLRTRPSVLLAGRVTGIS